MQTVGISGQTCQVIESQAFRCVPAGYSYRVEGGAHE